MSRKARPKTRRKRSRRGTKRGGLLESSGKEGVLGAARAAGGLLLVGLVAGFRKLRGA